MKKIFSFSVVLFLLSSCISSNNSAKYIPESIGNPYELFVVAPKNIYRGGLGDSLTSVLKKDVEMINFIEPSFDLYNIPLEGFKGVNVNHRNLLFIQMGKDFPVAKMYTIKDKYSKPQLITVLEAPDSAAMMQLIMEERYKVKQTIEQEELTRFATRATKYAEVKVSAKVTEMFDITLKIPQGYKLRNTVGNDFMWISYELPESSQGIVIYDYPYTGTTLNDSLIIAARNKFVARVPGELPGAYMTTGDYFDPETVVRNIKGREWYETRGFWRVENDFQGGPFVSFATIDTAKQRVVVIDCYVYSPNPQKKQRNFMKQLEGIVETAVVK